MFEGIKRYISSLPMLTSPSPHSTLILYLVVSNSTISLILVHEDGKKQYPIYFTRRTLQPTEKQYQAIEKLVLALIFSARRL